MDFSQITEAQLVAFFNDPKVAIAMMLLSLWALIWKGFALWKASKNDSRNWFIALLCLNTLGILEIIYLFYFSKKKEQSK
ncbi:MAG: DUF5652 family protein [Candidatus Staskawiczbacteria bacterium]